MKKASIEPEGSSLRELQQRYSNVRPPKTKRPAPSSRSGKYLNPKQLDRYNVQNSTLKHIKQLEKNLAINNGISESISKQLALVKRDFEHQKIVMDKEL